LEATSPEKINTTKIEHEGSDLNNESLFPICVSGSVALIPNEDIVDLTCFSSSIQRFIVSVFSHACSCL
jgi:hypothetical protein